MVYNMQADQWYRQLLRSHEMMQQVVGGADPASPLEMDWDTASATSTDQPEDDKSSSVLCHTLCCLLCDDKMSAYTQQHCLCLGCLCLPIIAGIPVNACISLT